MRKRLEAGANRKRISRQGARLVNGTERREQVHDFRGTGDRAHRHPAADYFPEHDEVRRDAHALGNRAEAEPEPGYNFVTNQQRAVGVRDFGERLERAWVRIDDAHVGGDRLDDHGGDFLGRGAK